MNQVDAFSTGLTPIPFIYPNYEFIEVETSLYEKLHSAGSQVQSIVIESEYSLTDLLFQSYLSNNISISVEKSIQSLLSRIISITSENTLSENLLSMYSPPSTTTTTPITTTPITTIPTTTNTNTVISITPFWCQVSDPRESVDCSQLVYPELHEYENFYVYIYESENGFKIYTNTIALQNNLLNHMAILIHESETSNAYGHIYITLVYYSDGYLRVDITYNDQYYDYYSDYMFACFNFTVDFDNEYNLYTVTFKTNTSELTAYVYKNMYRNRWYLLVITDNETYEIPLWWGSIDPKPVFKRYVFSSSELNNPIDIYACKVISESFDIKTFLVMLSQFFMSIIHILVILLRMLLSQVLLTPFVMIFPLLITLYVYYEIITHNVQGIYNAFMTLYSILKHFSELFIQVIQVLNIVKDFIQDLIEKIASVLKYIALIIFK